MLTISPLEKFRIMFVLIEIGLSILFVGFKVVFFHWEIKKFAAPDVSKK